MDSEEEGRLEIYDVEACNQCEIRLNDEQFRPYTLRYLALHKVINIYMKKNGQNKNLFDGMNLPSEWEKWKFAYTIMWKEKKKKKNSFTTSDFREWFFKIKTQKDRKVKLFSNVHSLVLKLIENPRYLIEIPTIDRKCGIDKYCTYCHTVVCKECGWADKKFHRLQRKGHLSQYINNY